MGIPFKTFTQTLQVDLLKERFYFTKNDLLLRYLLFRNSNHSFKFKTYDTIMNILAYGSAFFIKSPKSQIGEETNKWVKTSGG